MADWIAWSHSRRKDWMECPRMFYHKNVAPKGSADRVEFIQTAAMKAGNLIDDALTQRIAKGTPLPPQFAPYEKMAASVPPSRVRRCRSAMRSTDSPSSCRSLTIT